MNAAKTKKSKNKNKKQKTKNKNTENGKLKTECHLSNVNMKIQNKENSK